MRGLPRIQCTTVQYIIKKYIGSMPRHHRNLRTRQDEKQSNIVQTHGTAPASRQPAPRHGPTESSAGRGNAPWLERGHAGPATSLPSGLTPNGRRGRPRLSHSARAPQGGALAHRRMLARAGRSQSTLAPPTSPPAHGKADGWTSDVSPEEHAREHGTGRT